MAKEKVKTEQVKLIKASARSLHVSPRKMRLVTNLVKRMPVEEAIVQLQFTNKKAAGMLVKLLKSAVANAEHNFSLKPEDLYIKTITCDMGMTMKRYSPRARGSAFVIRRKLSNVNVTLEEKAGGKKKSRFPGVVKKAKEEPKEIKAVEVHEGRVDTKAQVNAPEHRKTSEQKKMNMQQQKRRMFNRKTGE
jgi:large subunit ribosomal protein L22